jgi:predicted membrane channel-forming protein YqfA (hemolysin III family)
MSNIIIRIFIFSYLICFVALNLYTFVKSSSNTKDEIKNLFDHFEINSNIIGNKFEIGYKIFLYCTALIAFFSICDIKVFQFLSGLITIIIGIVLYNPLINSNNNGFLKYFPSYEFLILFSLGIGMILNSLEEKKESPKIKEKKD